MGKVVRPLIQSVTFYVIGNRYFDLQDLDILSPKDQTRRTLLAIQVILETV
jgi:hypothetical protein